MPRSDDVRAESQPMMFVLASEMEPLSSSAIRRSVKGDGFLERPCSHFSWYLTSMNVHSFDGERHSGKISYEQCKFTSLRGGGTA